MRLINAKVGERILVYCQPTPPSYMLASANSPKTIPATVVAQEGGATVLAWKAGEQVPASVFTDQVLEKSWQDQGFVIAQRYGNHCECLLFLGAVAPSTLKEVPCKQCRKPNDIGVNKCWWCECEKPNGS